MELVNGVIDNILHLDKNLDYVLHNYGTWTYVLLFTIIFCETGLVITPILPGDSLLFATGTFAARESLDVILLVILLSVSAIAGDTVNYWIGKVVGPRVFKQEKARFFNKVYLERTHQFYEKHGGKTIIIARFLPIMRTFAPFVAGIGRMTYGRFIVYNVVGGIGWISIFVLSGYFFGSVTFVKNNFALIILGIIIVSVLPGIIEVLRQRYQSP